MSGRERERERVWITHECKVHPFLFPLPPLLRSSLSFLSLFLSLSPSHCRLCPFRPLVLITALSLWCHFLTCPLCPDSTNISVPWYTNRSHTHTHKVDHEVWRSHHYQTVDLCSHCIRALLFKVLRVMLENQCQILITYRQPSLRRLRQLWEVSSLYFCQSFSCVTYQMGFLFPSPIIIIF